MNAGLVSLALAEIGASNNGALAKLLLLLIAGAGGGGGGPLVTVIPVSPAQSPFTVATSPSTLNLYIVDTSAGAMILRTPPAPAPGDTFMAKGTPNSGNLLSVLGTGGQTIDGLAGYGMPGGVGSSRQGAMFTWTGSEWSVALVFRGGSFPPLPVQENADP